MSDIYNDVMLRRWSIDPATGQPECLHDAADVRLLSAEDRYAIELMNASVHDAVSREANSPPLRALRRVRSGEPRDGDADLVAATWTSPAPSAPSEDQVIALSMPTLTPRQIRLVMLMVGLTEADIEAQISNLVSDPTERGAALIEWRYASLIRFDHPLVGLLQTAMNFDADQLAALWSYAASIR